MSDGDVPKVKFRKRARPNSIKPRSKKSRNTFSTEEHAVGLQSEAVSIEPTLNNLPPKKSRLESRAHDTSDAQSKASNASRTDVNGFGDVVDQNNEEDAVRDEVEIQQLYSRENTKKKAFGPIRAPAHIRTTIRMDYQPDVCKDYKETGYCGFGDACKFLHDRSDYKAGWQLDQEWVEQQKQKNQQGQANSDDNDDDDELPFACYICRKEFDTPVMTLCEHFFCENCALERMRKEGTCAVCGKQMRGTLNAAPKLVAKLAMRHHK